MKGLSLLLPLLAFANNLNRISGLGFTQDWIRGEQDEGAHPHDGVELADDKGFVAVGSKGTSQMIVKRVDTEGNKVWSVHKGNHASCGQAVLQVENKIIVGGGLGRSGLGKMQATLWALDLETGETLWQTKLDHHGHGGIRGILLDGDTIVATGYTDGFEGGCLFINEEGTANLWTFDLEGTLKTPRRSTSRGCPREPGSELIRCTEVTWWRARSGRAAARTTTKTSELSNSTPVSTWSGVRSTASATDPISFLTLSLTATATL